MMNTSRAVQQGVVKLLDDYGVPLTVKQYNGGTDSSFRYQISRNGWFRFQTDGLGDSVRGGWIQVIPDSGTSAPFGAAVFSFNPGKLLLTESGVPAASTTTHAHIYVDLSEGHDSGLAIANPLDTSVAITINAFQADGSTKAGTGSAPLQLMGGGHSAKFADQFVSGLPIGFTGILDITCSKPFAAVTLRSLYNERHDFLFTTFPVADQTRPAPAPIIFPQIADGGGLATQFILIGVGSTSNAALGIYDKNGKPSSLLK